MITSYYFEPFASKFEDLDSELGSRCFTAYCFFNFTAVNLITYYS